MKKRLLCLCLAGLCSGLLSLARAEYRVFVLKIEKISSTPGTAGSFSLVESTLDPDQYRGYYPLRPDEKISYIETWRCFGRTDNRPLCPNPHKVQNQTPDSAIQGPVSTAAPAQ